MPLVGYPQRYGKRGSTLALLHGDEKSAGVLPKGTFSPSWSVGAVGFADKETSLSPPAFTQFFQTIFVSGRCQLTRFSLLPSYVVDGSSPKQPWMGGGRGSVGLSPLTRAFAGSKPHTLTRPFT